MTWWDDPWFNEYLRRFGELRGLNTARRWTLYQLARLADAVPGDTAECGVFQGAGSYLICKANQSSRTRLRTHFLFDSFEGLSRPAVVDGGAWAKGNLACGLDTAKANLREYDRLSWHAGWIPTRFGDVQDRTFSLVHIDVDLFEPTRDSLRFFFPRMSQGGIIVCDDYGFTTCPGATKAVDDYLVDRAEQMVALPCGGGFLIKGCTTAPALP
jgi:hypothetical protein